MSHPTLALVGAGRAGTGLAGALAATAGYDFVTVFDRQYAHSARLAAGIGSVAVRSLAAVRGDLVILAVSDSALPEVADALARDESVLWQGRGVVHLSGAVPITALEPLEARGAMIGGFHPAYPFTQTAHADGGTVAPDLRGVTFALETTAAPLQAWLMGLAGALGGAVLNLPVGGRVLYHSALVFASNYTVTLIALAERLLMSLGASPSEAAGALQGLVAGMVGNVRTQGAVQALTGPLVRADVGTVAAHLHALEGVDPDSAALYVALARATYPILAARGISSEAVEQIFTQDNSDAYFHT